MPTYEYTCDACGAAWEKEQRISENAIRECPHCGAAEARRLVSSGNFILKGSGWYADLYSKPAPAKSAGDGAKADGARAGDAGTSEGGKASEAAKPAEASGGKDTKPPAKPAATSG